MSPQQEAPSQVYPSQSLDKTASSADSVTDVADVGQDKATPETLEDKMRQLNDGQRAAVTVTEGPLLVLAGAGTGKTHALTSRLCHIVQLGLAKTSEILAVTFTNKAANEMRERLTRSLDGVETSGYMSASANLRWVGTFHSLSNKILRTSPESAGLLPNFRILDRDEQLRLVKQIISALNFTEKQANPKSILAQIDIWKNQALWPKDVTGQPYDQLEVISRTIYPHFQNRLQELNSVDFGDLIIRVIKMLKNKPEVAEDWRKRFRYLLVDEFQDINPAQYEWLRLLVDKHRNLCCVGDDDQSIYSWRGADVGVMLNFEKEWPGARIVRLEKNYRSTQAIMVAAGALISGNKHRHIKQLESVGAMGEKLELVVSSDSNEEAATVANMARMARASDSTPYSKMACLVRVIAQMRPLEDALISAKIPYRIVGGTRFYDREEIRDATAYLRLVINENDDMAFDRIINKPARGIGAALVDKVTQAARQNQKPKLETLRNLSEGDELPMRARTAAIAFLQLMASWRDAKNQLEAPQLLEVILDQSGYNDWLKESSRLDREGKLENLAGLTAQLDSMDSLESYLDHVALSSETDATLDQESNHDQERFNIMTIHGAKGLEFDTVFLPGWEEELFPHSRSRDEDHEMEEERRLAYVALTRARHRVIISFAQRRNIFGRWADTRPSRFLDELPRELIKSNNTNTFQRNAYHQRSGKQYFGSSRSSGSGRESASSFNAGDQCYHQHFGKGRVVQASDEYVCVEFKDGGRRNVLAEFLALVGS